MTTRARLGSTTVVLVLLSVLSMAPPLDAAETADDLSRRLCEALHALPESRKAACCGTSSTSGLAAECARDLSRTLRAKTVSLDPADVDRCVAESSTVLDGCEWVTPYLPRTPDSCRGIVHGRLEAGSRCRSSLECRDGLSCRGETSTEPGVCLPPGMPGASCGAGPDALATHARQTDHALHPECAGFCLRGRCAAFVAAGGACSSTQQCASGSHCVARRCVEGPRPTLGEPCDGTTCDGALVCIDGRCAHPRKAGESCTRSAECEATCLSPGATGVGTCGMACSAWPPAGYTPPVGASMPIARSHPIERRDP